MVVSLPDSRSPASVTAYILAVLEESDSTPYIGELISQLQHSLQCAAQAASASPAVEEKLNPFKSRLTHDASTIVKPRRGKQRQAVAQIRQRYPSHRILARLAPACSVYWLNVVASVPREALIHFCLG